MEVRFGGMVLQSVDLMLKWREAGVFAKRIEEVLQNGEMIVDHKCSRILNSNGDDEIIL